MIFVDTSLWSLAFRRPKGASLPLAAQTHRAAVLSGEPIAFPGVVLQELLSGLRHQAQFDRLAKTVEPFPVVLASRADHLLAAQLANACRAKGVQTGAVDILIVAMTINHDAGLWATDRDYLNISEVHPFRLRVLPAD